MWKILLYDLGQYSGRLLGCRVPCSNCHFSNRVQPTGFSVRQLIIYTKASTWIVSLFWTSTFYYVFHSINCWINFLKHRHSNFLRNRLLRKLYSYGRDTQFKGCINRNYISFKNWVKNRNKLQSQRTLIINSIRGRCPHCFQSPTSCSYCKEYSQYLLGPVKTLAIWVKSSYPA